MKVLRLFDQAIMLNDMYTESDIEVHNLGIVPYSEALDMQRGYANELIDAKKNGCLNVPEHLILLEHNDVYTLGKHAHESNLLFPEEYFRKSGAEVIRIDRGGDVTYHGPGQLVVYPIIDLERHKLGVKSYVDLLEQSIIDMLLDYGIQGERVEGATGVWLDTGKSTERKICAIGIRCSRFVTMHGLALNVNTDLKKFNLINPCGFTDKGVTSIARELGHTVNFAEAKEKFTRSFINNIYNR